MSPLLLAIVTVIYGGVAASEWSADRPGMSLVFVGYALANVGLIWQTLR